MTQVIVAYPDKETLKQNVGQPLLTIRTDNSPPIKETGRMVVSNKPSVSKIGKKQFYAVVFVRDGKIESVQ